MFRAAEAAINVNDVNWNLFDIADDRAYVLRGKSLWVTQTTTATTTTINEWKHHSSKLSLTLSFSFSFSWKIDPFNRLVFFFLFFFVCSFFLVLVLFVVCVCPVRRTIALYVILIFKFKITLFVLQCCWPGRVGYCCNNKRWLHISLWIVVILIAVIAKLYVVVVVVACAFRYCQL